VANQGWSTSDGRGYVNGAAPCPVGEPSPCVAGSAGPGILDPNEILASVGEVPYAWLIASDTLVWGRNVGDVLPIDDPMAIASGRGFAQLIDPQSGQSRADVLMRPTSRDEGAAVAVRRPTSRQARTGSDFPFSVSSPTGSNTNRGLVRRYVASLTYVDPAGAAASSRCAPTASCARSTSAMSARRSLPILRASTRLPAR